MQRLEVSGAVRPIYGSLGVKRLIFVLVTYYLTFPCSQHICAHMNTTYPCSDGISRCILWTAQTSMLALLQTYY